MLPVHESVSCPLRVEQHISFSKKLFCAIHIQNRSGIRTRSHRKCNPARHICFDQTGDDIHRWTLGCNHQMNPRRSCQLCQSADGLFHVIGSYHHKICKLVHNDHNLWHLLRALLPFRYFNGIYLCVVSIDFTHICLRKFFISFRHFRNCPVQSTGCFFRIG